jgi:hypothetical protein
MPSDPRIGHLALGAVFCLDPACPNEHLLVDRDGRIVAVAPTPDRGVHSGRERMTC